MCKGFKVSSWYDLQGSLGTQASHWPLGSIRETDILYQSGGKGQMTQIYALLGCCEYGKPCEKIEEIVIGVRAQQRW